MKKLLVIASLVVGVLSGNSQGVVDFRNNQTFATTPTNSTSGFADRLVRNPANAPLVGTNFAVQLYFAVGANQAGASLVVVPGSTPGTFRTPTTTFPGTFANGGNRTLPGVVSGQTATLQLRVFDLNQFSTYEAALAAGGTRGVSPSFNYTVPAAGAPPAAFFMEGLGGFAIVPEPSTIALGFIGVAALLLRRRKS